MANKKISIFYDYQMLVMQRFGGISRYIFDLASVFSKTHHVITPVLFPKSYYFESYFNKKSTQFALWRWNKPFVYLVNKFYAIVMLRVKKPDILHLTYYHSYLLPFIPADTKLVITAHDMIHEIYPDLFPRWDFTSKHKKKVFKRADLIIAISENTKKDLITFFEINPNKIEVIYHGNPFDEKLSETIPLLETPYFLFVGQRETYKNFDTLIHAIAPILMNTQHQLLCIGGKPFNEFELSNFKTLGIDHLVLRRNCTDSELKMAYKNALCLIYPSEYEGFGIPILEAWAMGCPLILSNASCFPEIAKDAALYFESSNEEELRIVINQLLSDEILRQSIVEKGLKYVKQFTLAKTASQTMSAYYKLLNKSENV